MRNLQKQDLYWILRRLPKRVLGLMEFHPGLFLAGGFIRACVANEDPSDIDLFAPDEDHARLYAAIIAGNDGRVFYSKNAITIRIPDVAIPVQVIHRWTYTKPEELIESFDFTVAKTAVWCAEKRDETTRRPRWESLVHDDFYADLAAKRLSYTKPQRNEDAGGSLLRVLKFYQKGYRIPLDSMSAVIARLIMGVDMAKLEGVAEALGGATREEVLGTVITGLLHEVDPLQDPHHIFHLPSYTDTKDEALKA